MKDIHNENITFQTNSSDDTQTGSVNEGKTSGRPSPKRK